MWDIAQITKELLNMRKYEIYADNGHDGLTIEYYSTHRAGSNANLEDARKELNKRFGWWAKTYTLIVRTCFLLGE